MPEILASPVHGTRKKWIAIRANGADNLFVGRTHGQVP